MKVSGIGTPQIPLPENVNPVDVIRRIYPDINASVLKESPNIYDRRYISGATREQSVFKNDEYVNKKTEIVHNMERVYSACPANFTPISRDEANTPEGSWLTVISGRRPMGQFSVDSLFSPDLHALHELPNIGCKIFPKENNDFLYIVVVYRKDCEQGELYANKFIELYNKKRVLMNELTGETIQSKVVMSELAVAREMGTIFNYLPKEIDDYIDKLKLSVPSLNTGMVEASGPDVEKGAGAKVLNELNQSVFNPLTDNVLAGRTSGLPASRWENTVSDHGWEALTARRTIHNQPSLEHRTARPLLTQLSDIHDGNITPEESFELLEAECPNGNNEIQYRLLHEPSPGFRPLYVRLYLSTLQSLLHRNHSPETADRIAGLLRQPEINPGQGWFSKATQSVRQLGIQAPVRARGFYRQLNRVETDRESIDIFNNIMNTLNERCTAAGLKRHVLKINKKIDGNYGKVRVCRDKNPGGSEFRQTRAAEAGIELYNRAVTMAEENERRTLTEEANRLLGRAELVLAEESESRLTNRHVELLRELPALVRPEEVEKLMLENGIDAYKPFRLSDGEIRQIGEMFGSREFKAIIVRQLKASTHYGKLNLEEAMEAIVRETAPIIGWHFRQKTEDFVGRRMEKLRQMPGQSGGNEESVALACGQTEAALHEHLRTQTKAVADPKVREVVAARVEAELQVAIRTSQESETRRIAEAEARRIAEAEVRRVAESDARKAAEAEARKVAEAEARKAAEDAEEESRKSEREKADKSWSEAAEGQREWRVDTSSNSRSRRTEARNTREDEGPKDVLYPMRRYHNL